MDLILESLRVLQILILGFGGVVIYYAYRAHSRTKSRAMLLLAVGFAFVTVGAIAAGILFELANVGLESVEAVQAAAQAAGFFIIFYSLKWTKD